MLPVSDNIIPFCLTACDFSKSLLGAALWQSIHTATSITPILVTAIASMTAETMPATALVGRLGPILTLLSGMAVFFEIEINSLSKPMLRQNYTLTQTLVYTACSSSRISAVTWKAVPFIRWTSLLVGEKSILLGSEHWLLFATAYTECPGDPSSRKYNPSVCAIQAPITSPFLTRSLVAVVLHVKLSIDLLKGRKTERRTSDSGTSENILNASVHR